MARVNLDGKVWKDPRVKRLARRRGWSMRETVGTLAAIWDVAYDAKNEVISAEDLDTAAETDGFAVDMVAERLATPIDDVTIRLRGISERIAYLVAQSERGRAGGKARSQRTSGAGQANATKANQRPGERLAFAKQPPSLPPDHDLDPSLAPDRPPDPDARARDALRADDVGNGHPASFPTGIGIVQPGTDGERVETIHMRVPGTFAAQQAAKALMANVLTAQPGHRAHRWPEAQRAQAVARWAETIEILHRVDGVPMEAISETVEWVSRDPFWSTTIAGADALRQHWDKIQGQRHRKPAERSQTKGALEVLDDIDRELADARRKATP